tara:strand:- start:7243 stop:7704 length:462 start_codon:yes stop_codon:yes gene_type:complete
MSFDKNVWGNATWYLFHTLAYKIKESDFPELKNDIIYIVKTIATNLPCPDCSQDAANQLSKVQFDNISNKEELKLLLFNFHNYVNRKLGKSNFEISQLDDKYSNANINAIYNNFFKIYNSNSNTPQLMSASFHRKYNIPKIKIALDRIISKLN